MESRTSSVEDGNSPRVKFLCSFGGSILPRPQDGKLRYVGGDTRIVSLPRHFGYEELLVRMREVFEGVAVVKYQQSDEDLDALVSVFNDDDVMNMMEEYLKLGLGDGVALLRILLFTELDCNDLVWFDDDDKEESHRKYLDALNSIKSNAGGRKQSLVGSPVLGSAEGVRVSGGVLLNLGSIEKQSNCELNFLRQNLNLLTIPHMDTGHSQHFLSQSYSEMKAPWSPAYCSPGHQVHQDIRPMAEFPISPSSGFYHVQSRGFPDKLSDPMRERQPAIQQHSVVDKVGRLSPGSTHVDMNGSPPILTLAPGAYKGMDNSVHGLCQMTSHRNQTSSDAICNPDFFWKHGEQPNGGRRHKKLDHGVCSKEQNETQTLCSDAQVHETGVGLHQHLHLLGEAPIVPVSGAGMVNQHNVSHATSMTSTPFALGNYSNGHHSFMNHNNHEDPGYVRPAPELVYEGFHGQTTGATPHILISPNEDLGVRYGNHHALAYGMDNAYTVSNGPTPAHSTWRTAQNGFHDHPSYEPSISLPQVNGVVNSGNLRGVTEDSPSLGIGANNKNYLLNPSKKVLPHDSSAAQMYHMGYAPKLILNNLGQGYQYPMPSDSNQPRPDLIDFATPMELVLPFISSSSVMNDKMSASTYNPETVYGTATRPVILDAKNVANVLNSNVMAVTSYPEKHMEVSKKVKEEGVNSNGFQLTEGKCDTEKKSEIDSSALSEPEGLSAKSLSFLPDLIASVKRVALEGAENVRVQGNADGCMDQSTKEDTSNEFESVKAHVECEVGSDGGHANISKIEPTKAEAEALARGLQTIRNDDLEEIRLLGSGAYGAVYHGKWKGSDVAIKRIRANCFAGRPSERERLIADFWKEALILSSLHHPNVVSFYGIVCDGPDGSLATLTEFMINGSLKQFLQKKDRTIDRRKRLIIAMDAAFGMEYLHEKNIVHFDLKCENLLVNMRDPHRPVCKIGDMGLSKVNQHTLVSGGVRGTLPWMAPELMNGQSTMVTEKIDVYSFGIVMWELLTGEEPYSGGIVSNTLRPQVPAWCDPEWKSLMESCWASDAAERPSFSEISQKLGKMYAAIVK